MPHIMKVLQRAQMALRSLFLAVFTGVSSLLSGFRSFNYTSMNGDLLFLSLMEIENNEHSDKLGNDFVKTNLVITPSLLSLMFYLTPAHLALNVRFAVLVFSDFAVSVINSPTLSERM